MGRWPSSKFNNISKNTVIPPESSIISVHFFSHFSEEKIAANVDTMDDGIDFYQTTKHLDPQKWLLMGMGKYGKIYRGMFACVPLKSVVPGQIDFITLKTLFAGKAKTFVTIPYTLLELSIIVYPTKSSR